MSISDYLTVERTVVGAPISSKKKLLEFIAETLLLEDECSNTQEILEAFYAREMLGPTGLGNGIATPHGRADCCQHIRATFLILESPIAFDAPDGQPVDVVFGLLVPQETDQEHLNCLREIANVLKDNHKVSQMRHAHNNEALYEILLGHIEKESAA